MSSVSVREVLAESVGPGSRWLLAGVSVVAVVVAASGFALGRVTAPDTPNTGLSLRHIADLRPELEAQRKRLDASREELAAGQAAVARRLGQMQAEILRLNAAGSKLTELARLDPSEFDFGVEPAIGGPALPGEDLLEPSSFSLDELAMQLELKSRQLDVLEQLLLVSQLHSDQYPSGWPVKKGWVSSLFGKRTDPFTGRRTKHSGVDFAARYGSDVVAVAGGMVTFAGVRRGYGKLVEINHGNGYVTRYAHNSENLVRIGDVLSKGDVIAKVGKTGRATGAHVHFEVLADGQRIDPHQYISSR